jgi:UPF0755 protein
MPKKPRKKSSLILPQLVILVLLAGSGWYWVSMKLNQRLAHQAAERIVTITPGSSQQQILRQLENEGILQTTWPVRLWLRTFGRNLRLKAGDYRFPSPISAREAIELLARGQVATRTITIPEDITAMTLRVYWQIFPVCANPLRQRRRAFSPSSIDQS